MANQPIRLALDVMGADRGPAAIVAGAALAAQEFGDSVEIVLVGDQNKIQQALKELGKPYPTLSVHHAPHEVLMTDSPSEAVRKEGTSVAEGLRLHKQGKVDAFVSPGNTGAVMAGALLTLGRTAGVNRPAICAVFPTSSMKTTTVLDVGANATCKPVHLVQFAALGAAYHSAMHSVERPRVGLLSIGEERSKGNELVMQAHELLTKSTLNFVGNIEGRDILTGDYDVVVTDGFTGNIVLKFAESIETFLTRRIRHQVSTNVFSRAGAILMAPFLRRLRTAFDYAEAGGAPLLGIDGVTMICHGSSSPRAIRSGLVTAHRMIVTRVIDKTRQLMKQNDLFHIAASAEQSAKSSVQASTSETRQREQEPSLETSHR